MSTNHYKTALLSAHGAVLLFALSGLFAKWISLPAPLIALGRAFFAAMCVALVLIVVKQSFRLSSRKSYLVLATTGIILAVHWVSFFAAIQLSNVTLGMLTVATYPIFCSLLEPFYFNEKLEKSSVFQALLTVVGIYIVLPDFSINNDNFYGVLVGVFAAFCFAIITLLNRKYVRKYSALQVSFYQNSFAALTLLPLLLFVEWQWSTQDFALIILLAVVFTAFAHTLFTKSLTTINAQTASIIVSLEPLYGIVAAIVFLGESINQSIVIGGAFILLANIWTLKKPA